MRGCSTVTSKNPDAQTMALDLRPVLHRCCQQISPTYSDYAARPIQDGFSWSSSLAGCAFDALYLVVFRSVRRPSADLDLRRECLSFCLWETRKQAKEAAGAASHRSAADISVPMYESYVLERYWLKKVLTPREERLIFEPIEPIVPA